VLSFPPSVRLFVATQPVDGRKGPDSLMALVRDVLRHDPLSGHLFIFFFKRQLLEQNLSPREWGRALEALKQFESLPNDFHGIIDAAGDLIDPASGNAIGNLLDFLP
jgi:hypothetical protein